MRRWPQLQALFVSFVSVWLSLALEHYHWLFALTMEAAVVVVADTDVLGMLVRHLLTTLVVSQCWLVSAAHCRCSGYNPNGMLGQLYTVPVKLWEPRCL